MPSVQSAPITARSRYLIASTVVRTWAGGAVSSGSFSDFTIPPVRAYGHGAKLCATKRFTPTARPAASRWSVPFVRSSFVGAKSRSMRRGLKSLIAVSWWTITSGSASATARATPSGSRASATTGRAPSSRRSSVLDSLRVMPVTS